MTTNKYRHKLDFFMAMTEKEIKARYKRTIFGFLWVVINPLFQMAVIGFVFSFFVDIPNYPLFLLIGLLPWQFFSLSISKATPSFVYESSLLKKAAFPKEAIPISIILSSFFHFIIAMFILVFFICIVTKITLIGLATVLLALIWLLALTIGISLFTASLNVEYRDIHFLTQSALTLLFYLTPIYFNFTFLPPRMTKILSLNPLSSIFELLHISLLKDGHISKEHLISNLVVSTLIILVGILTFRKKQAYFNDWF